MKSKSTRIQESHSQPTSKVRAKANRTRNQTVSYLNKKATRVIHVSINKQRLINQNACQAGRHRPTSWKVCVREYIYR